MSNNFLDQFSKKDFKVESTDNKPMAEKSSNSRPEAKKTTTDRNDFMKSLNNKSEIKEPAKDVDLSPLLDGGSKGSNQKIATTEHIVEKDNSYHKRKMIRYGVIGGSVLAVCIAAFFIVRMVNQVEIKDFVGTTIGEARTWGLTNGISVDFNEEYSLEFDVDRIIEQSVEPNSRLQRGSVLTLTVSLGADQSELIELPDFEEMTTAEVRNWRQELQLFNVNIREEYSDEVEEGRFIRKEFGSNAVNEENYTRGDGLIIFMSKGEEVFEANIEVPDFEESPLVEVEKWASDNDIELTVEENTSNSVPVDFIISQSIPAGEKIARHDELTVVVSLGQTVTVPNFANLTAEEAMDEMASGLNIRIQHRFSASVAFGRLISQSVPAGRELMLDDDPRVTVIYSLGRPFMEDMTGQSESEIAPRFHEFTSQGANITYTINYVDSWEPRGTIVSMSRYGQFLSMTDHVTFSVSRGNRTPPVEEPPAFEPEPTPPPAPTPTPPEPEPTPDEPEVDNGEYSGDGEEG